MLQLPGGGLPKNPQPNGLGYNPRCLSRDISLQAANATTDAEVVRLLKNYTDIATFQREYQGAFAEGRMGVHTGGRKFLSRTLLSLSLSPLSKLPSPFFPY